MSEKIVTLNEEAIKGEIRELVRGSVEETLNNLLEAEADKLTQARRYERNEARQGYRSGHYDRGLTTTSGEVTLHVPRLNIAFHHIEWQCLPYRTISKIHSAERMRFIVFSYVAEKSFRAAFISGRCPAVIKNTQWVKFAHRNIVTSVSKIISKQYAHRHRHVVLLPAQPR